MEIPNLNFTPKYLSHIDSWHEHIFFAHDLVKAVSPKIIVELGVHYGDSYFTLCQSVKENHLKCQCYGIDTWQGEEHSGFYGEEVWQTVKKYNDEHYSSFSNLIRQTFESAVCDFEEGSIDILHIDGLHTYEAVKSDFFSWIPKVSPDGVILLHDIEEYKEDFGVWRFWKELKNHYRHFSFKHGHGLGVIFNQKDPSHANSCFSELDSSIFESLYYSIRGKQLILNKEIDELKKRNRFLSDQNSKHQKNEINLLAELEDQKFLSDTLSEEISENETELSSLNESLAKTIQENLLMIDKVNRTINSFSWKISAPLRFLRRKIVDPLFRSKNSFDARTYLRLNPDLEEAFGQDLDAAEKHFKTLGKKEGREYLAPATQKRITYRQWVKEYDTIGIQSKKKFDEEYKNLKISPLISIIIPVFNISPKIFLETLNSVKSQIYQNWELVIVDDCSTREDLIENLNNIEISDNRIRLTFRKKNGHISEASNSGLQIAEGDFVLFLDHDDLLREHSLLRIVQAIEKNPKCKLIYTDEDKINYFGKRSDPYFKPDWNPDLLLSQNYICHLSCISKEILKEIGGFRKGYEGCQDWDLFLRATEKIQPHEIIHIPEILYHWRKVHGSTASKASAKHYVFENSIKTIDTALKRRKIKASVNLSNDSNNYIHIKYSLPKRLPLVSIIIPTRDYQKFLSVCVEGVLNKNSYENYEILILDNESKEKTMLDYLDQLANNEKVRIIRVPGEFNYSKINNTGVKYAKGEILLFLNNDTEPINKDWLNEMVSHAIRENIGCVGAKLLYPNDTVQHGGVIIGLGGIAGHAFKGFAREHTGYKNRLSLVQNYSAVTGACMMIRKSIFFEVGGFNAKDLKVAFNDVDLCLKVREAGYLNLWTPHALLYHFESISRGDDLSTKKKKRFIKEGEYIKRKWSSVVKKDPYYNKNLTKDREDFSLNNNVF